jgi:hypothetical protein
MSIKDGHDSSFNLPDARPVEAAPAGKEGRRGKGKYTRDHSAKSSPLYVFKLERDKFKDHVPEHFLSTGILENGSAMDEGGGT